MSSARRQPLPVRRILVAIQDVHKPPRSQLAKAASIARAMHARVELFHAINEPIALETIRRGHAAGASYPDLLKAAATRSQNQLDRLLRAPLFRRVDARAVTTWDYPPHEAIIRRALASKADLVVAAARPHRFGARLILTNTDWELIRQCPVSLLLVKSTRQYRKAAVIAAVDPFHAHAKPAKLDERILAVSSTFATRLRGQVHAFHAYMPVTFITPAPVGQPLAITLPPELEDMHGQRVTQVFDQLAGRHGIPPSRRHLCMGEVSAELERVVRRTRAALVVMGAVSRSALQRMFIGSTAERVLDQMTCDLLVVKSRAFKTGVGKRMRAPLPLPVG
jgi:universal stress protein E